MTNNLLNAFKKMLNETDWMDDESKQVAIEKVNKKIQTKKCCIGIG